MNRFLLRFSAAVGTAALLVASSGLASADNVKSEVAAGGSTTITLGDGTHFSDIDYWIQDTSGGCDATGTTAVVVTPVLPAGITASPASVSFNACDVRKTIRYTASATGNFQIEVTSSPAVNNPPAKITLAVTNASNTPPVLTVPASPVAAEAASASGATVSYSATATDAQDNPDPTPVCTPASGALFPIGSTVVNCTVTDAGGLTDSDSFTVVVRDTTDPTVNVSTTATVGLKGWYNIASSGTAGIVVTVTAADAVGVSDVSCTNSGNASALDLGAPLTLTDGIHNMVCTATDAAGNSDSDSDEFKVDQTGPTMTAALTPPANTNGWNNSDVAVTYTCGDVTSGLDTGHGPAAGCWAPDSVTSDGLTTFNRAIADNAGNVGLFEFSVRRDTGAPSIFGSATPPANGNGWNNTNVAVAFSCFDDLSTIDTCTGNTTLTAEGANQSVTGTATDKAGNSNTHTVGPISIDKTNPTIGSSRTPAANGAGWNNGPVTVTFDCTDALSDVDTLTAPIVLNTEGADQSATGVCVDNAGNTSTVTVNNIDIDLTKPTITGSRSPVANTNGWNNGDVAVSFSCVDGGPSGIATDTVAGDTVTTEGANQAVTNSGVCVDTAGNAADAATVGDINIDKTNPVITGSASPAPNSANWNNTNVTVSFSCDDDGAVRSGIFIDTVAGQTLSSDAADQSVTNTGDCVDKAGNAADPETVSNIDIDQTKPTITGSRSPMANDNGWNNGDVTVSFTCADGGPSGIASDTVAGNTSMTTEGVNQSVTNTGECVDAAGNVADSATVSGINIDKTKPVISGSASPAPNGAGWNKENVVVSFTCDEAGAVQSGIDSNTVAGQTLSTDGADQSVTNTGECVDEAGNAAASATVNNLDIDKTAPNVTVTGVADGATYTLGSVPVAGCSTSDATSGVKTEATLSSTGGPVGSVTATCSGALDNADNSGSASATYNVVYAWSGFFQPIDNSPATGPIVFNKAKAGQSIPAKFSLGGDQGLNIIAAGYPKVTTVVCSSTAEDLIEVYAAATANNGLVYDATANQYNYVWKTQTSYANSCRKFDLMLNDGTHHVAYFKFTK